MKHSYRPTLADVLSDPHSDPTDPAKRPYWQLRAEGRYQPDQGEVTWFYPSDQAQLWAGSHWAVSPRPAQCGKDQQHRPTNWSARGELEDDSRPGLSDRQGTVTR